MKKFILNLLMMILITSGNSYVQAESPEYGQIRVNDGKYEAWDDKLNSWVTPDVFWKGYANEQGGLTWGNSKVYPPYEKVKEHDKLIIEVSQGTCLMEFFHERWRRANDVRRWDTEFNKVNGCPYVFD